MGGEGGLVERGGKRIGMNECGKDWRDVSERGRRGGE